MSGLPAAVQTEPAGKCSRIVRPWADARHDRSRRDPRSLRDTGGVSSDLPAFALPAEPAEPGALDRLPDLLDAALRVWSDTAERRRMRAFGFVPALEPGVLKREWHGSQVRVAQGRLVVRAPGWGELTFRAEGRELRHDGAPAEPSRRALALAEAVVGLIQSYERWVEAREGREERLRRGHWSGPDPRPMNALAETRRIQRMLHSAWRSGTRR